MNLQVDTVVYIAAAMAVGGFIKGGTGAGLPQVAIPVMATFLGVETAVVIMAIPGIVTNTWLIWNHRNHFQHTRDLPALLATGIVGAIAGTSLLHSLDEGALSFFVAGMVGLYTIVFFAHPDFKLRAGVTRYTSPPVGLASGLLQGATGMSGPVVATYIHAYRLPKEVFVVSITTVFQVYAVVQALTLLGLGLYTTERAVVSVLSLIPIMAMLPVGARVATHLSRRTFDLVVLSILLASAAKLVFDAVA
ncbi:MAG TPA: sulfite exporter TauE/SafE family protein [Actinomycetota bacterium]|nr:sulfite exporter TauE/SafE family protein [Actinomycetota bacterium]